MSKALTYRPEIDGLRAVAVIAVVLFHIDPHWLKGGFLGVDVFFVLSGYLITAIIQQGINKGKFSLKEFWLRRVKRLYPALLAMVAIVTTIGNFVLINPERRDLFLQTIGAIFSFSNILLWKTTGGYWDNSSENLALLHTWSLSLEEQFYIFFPTTLFLLNRYAQKLLLPALYLIAITSLALSILYTPTNQDAAFYLLPTRMWELMIGSLLALHQVRSPKMNQFKWASVATLIGLAIIIISFFTVAHDKRFPGAQPLLTCAGTALILAYGNASGLVKKVLQTGPIVYIGKISYSLYLWHWPVIVFARFLSPENNTLILLLLPVLLASLSYHFIENPFRTGFKGSFKVILAMPAIVAICILPLRLVDESPGIPEELRDLETNEKITRARDYEATDTLKQKGVGRAIGEETDSPDILIFGSSHARVLTPPIAEYARTHHESVEVLAVSGIHCTDTEAMNKQSFDATVVKNRLERIRSIKPELAILAEMWSSVVNKGNFEANVGEILTTLSMNSKKVVVLSQVPMVELPKQYKGAFNKYLLAKVRSGQSTDVTPNERVISANKKLQDFITELALPNVEFLDIHSDLITVDNKIKITEAGSLLYFDRHHVNHKGAEFVFESKIKTAIANSITLPTENTISLSEESDNNSI